MYRLPSVDNSMIDDGYWQDQCVRGECDCGRDEYQEWADEQCVRGEEYRISFVQEKRDEYAILHELGLA